MQERNTLGVRGITAFVYPMRTLGAYTAALVTFLYIYRSGDVRPYYLAFLPFVLIYPHVVFLLSRRLESRRTIELLTVYIDSFVLGSTIYISGFSLLPTVTFLGVALANGLALGGWRLMMLSVTALAVGALAPMPFYGFNFAPQDSYEIDLVCSLFLLVYFNIFAYTAYNRTVALQVSRRELRQQKLTLDIEKKKSDNFLMSLLPTEVARELERTGKVQPCSHDSVTLLMIDFPNFAAVTRGMNAAELVQEVNTCFKAFDAIVRRHGMECLKTVASAYFAVAGLPQPRESHARDAIAAALEIKHLVDEMTAARSDGKPWFELRIVVHSGPLIAGVVETRKFSFDVWGDTFDALSLMRRAVAPGQFVVSDATRQLVGDQLEFSALQAIPFRNGTNIEVYSVLAASTARWAGRETSAAGSAA